MAALLQRIHSGMSLHGMCAYTPMRKHTGRHGHGHASVRANTQRGKGGLGEIRERGGEEDGRET